MLDMNDLNKAHQQLTEAGIPEHCHDGIIRYVWYGVPPGGFLTSVFANDFKGAVTRSDTRNKAALEQYAYFIIWEVPSACQGSMEAVEQWIAQGGIHGQASNREAG